MANRTCSRRELLERWRGIEEEEDDDDPPPSKQRQIRRTKDEWFSDTFNHLISLPKETHIWCGCWELMGPLLETFHNYFEEKHHASPLKLIWDRISREMRECTQCICQHHQAQEMYSTEYEPDTVGPLLTVLRILDEERITEHLKDLNGRITRREYDLECYNAEVVSIMFEVLMYPILLDDQSLVKEFQIFIEAIDNSHELTLAGQQQYPGVYALLFLKSGRARAIGLRLAGCMGNLRRAKDLEPLQPLLKRCIGILEADVMPPTLETSRPRLHLERSLEALQDGEHEKQRRHLLYFLLHQVTQSRNFSPLMRQKARKIAFLIIHRGYKMNPPCPPFECAHMWGPPLLCSLKDSSLHNSLQQPAFDLIQTIIVSDAAALISLRLKDQVPSVIGMSSCTDLNDDEDEILFAHASEGMESTGWTEISFQSALAFQESNEWFCVPMLWINVMFEINPTTLPISFSKAVLWGLSRFPMMEPESNIETTLPIKDWLSLYADQISASFGWEVPRGSDDGGDGMVSRNSVKASAMLVPLIRTFKRCAASFVIQMEKAEFQKQCTWEPKMAESLILLLIDPNDSVRQAVRVLMEYFSKTREGGFLRQPILDHLPVTTPDCSPNIMDMRSWEKFSCLLSRVMWPSMLKCLAEGKAFLNSKSSQVSFLEDTVAIDVLREQVSQLSVSLSEQISDTIDMGVCKKKPSFLEPLPLETKGSAARSYLNDLPNKSCKNEVIIVSDDEGENVASPKAVGLSGSEINQQAINEIGLASADMSIIGNNDQGGPLRSTVPRNLSKNIVTEVAGNSRFSSQKPDNEVPGTDHLSSAISSKSRFSSQKLGNEVLGTDHLSSTLTSSIGARDRSLVCDNRKSDSAHQSSIQSVASKSSDKLARNSSTVVDQKKEDALIKELISDKSDDPLDMALNNARHPTPMLTKPSASVPKRKVIQLQMPIENKSAYLLGLSSLHEGEHSSKTNLKEVPLCFQSADHYVEIFRPLVLEEFKAQLRNSYMEISSLEEMFCGSICVLSVEKIDEFHLLRCLPDDQELTAFRGCTENDLVLLSKEPLKHSAQNLHVVGKVERREKNHKSRSSILVIRLYLPNSLLRLNKVNRLLIERSKWFVTRIMSITPQLREFQALSSIKDIPLLPVILNPTDHSVGHSDNSKVEISMLSQPMQQTLISSFNESQLRAIGIAIATCDLKKISELSLIQGPPGTGKTKTIVAIVSGLLALGGSRKNALKDSSNTPRDSSTSRMRISQSAAIARAWQDAAYAKQLAKDGEKDCTVSTENSTRARVLICAQSNAAVDELVSRITGGIFGNDGKFYKPYLVRVGNVKTVHPASLPFFIDTLVEQRLAEDGMNENGPKIETGRDSSQSLRAKLEKLMDSIRFYESMRANGKLDTKASEDGPLKVDDVGHEISDEALGAKLKILYGQKKAIYADLAAVQAREKKSSDEIKALKHNMRRSILREAEIVVTTLSGCGGDLYGVCSDSASRCGNLSEHSLFDAVVIDEAAQALEPATLIPLQLLKSSRTKCIMVTASVGDPKQLPATVLSNLASKFLYQCSMFERLQRAGYPVTMLTDQYRMHPEICRFPSLHFYENKLRDGVLMASKSATFHENICLGPFVFFDIVDGHEYHGKDSGSLSLCNDSEADAAVEITRFFKKRQLTLLRSRFTSAFGSDAIADVEFNTIDGFQGREVDILMLSTVRASDLGVRASGNQSSAIGFVADVRRMNVALTRAKLSLWIVGNARTLQTNIHWDALINNAKERKLLMSIGRPYGSIFTKSPSSFKRNLSSNSDSLRSINQGSKVKESRHCLTIIEQEVVQPTPSSAVECSTGEHVAGNEGKSYKAKRRRDNKEGAMQSVKEKTMGHHKSSQNGKPVKTGSATKTSSKMAKDLAESSEHGTTGEVMRGDIASSHDSSHQVNEVAGMEHVPNNLVATRKRQRDAVDALLSSALLSSKTSKTSLKSDPGKKALSSTMDPPTSPKGQVQEMVSGTAIPPQTRHHSSRHKNSGDLRCGKAQPGD
ncbi:putative helicase MAGATAMA 3 [Acorus calamus]|uniref:Helicase MAGATAMA 3 n=1 Tax=Acorus calamus TaxID=4465 RepID=A0AAV9CMW0_ACOCL|nr:putative helicase MAGATAMA 3 [Acorus calamus]